MGALAAELGCSRKHLGVQFREHIGLAPKAAARLVRFNHALRLVRDGGRTADVAQACGYADQAHLTREFRGFSGSTPRELVPRLAAESAETAVQFVQDTALAVA